MLPINPLAPFFPDTLSFIIYGLMTGGGLRFWSVAKRHVALMLVYLPFCVFWLFVMWAFMRVQPESRQIWFAVGMVIAFVRFTAIIRYLFGFMADVWIYRRELDDLESRRQSKSQNQQQWDEAFIRAEQARRQAEAETYRASQQGQGHQANNETDTQSQKPPHQEKIKHKFEDKPKAPFRPAPFSPENRSYEQILGLPAGWTAEDLKNAYKRESQRTHPDKWIGKPEHIRQVMEAEYKAIQEAYRKLKSH
jgi:hypothetical protein